MQIEGLAGRGRRLAATAIDMVLVPALTILLIMVTDVVEDAEDYVDNTWMLWVLLLAIASYLLLNGYTLWRGGQTLGKRLLGIAVIRAPRDGGLAGEQHPAALWKLILLRAWFFPLLVLIIVPPYALLPLLDHLFIFGKRRRCLHDWICATMVVRVKQNN